MSTNLTADCIAYTRVNLNSMNRPIPELPFDMETLKHLIQKSEPLLTLDEKRQMFQGIEQRTIKNRKSIKPFRTWWVAASIITIIFTLSFWFYFDTSSSPYQRLANLVNVDTLKQVSLFIDDQRLDLPKQSEIAVLTNGVEVRPLDGEAFKISSSEARQSYAQVAVPKGQKVKITLSDGSRITLREESKLIFPLAFKASKRTVHLVGEAYMQIAHDDSKRFVTLTDKLNVSVLGTQFLVSAYPNRVDQSVLLVSGKVEVEPQKGKKVILKPNEQLIYSTQTQAMTLKRELDPMPLIGWKEDLMIIHEESLSQVLKHIEEIYKIDLTYDWTELEKIKINGKLDMSVPVDELFDRLSKIAPIKVVRKQNQIFINVESLKSQKPMN